MVHRRQAEAASGQRSRPNNALQLETLPRTQPVVVVDLRCEGTDLRMQAPGLIEEETALRRHRRLTGQQMIQGRHLGSWRMSRASAHTSFRRLEITLWLVAVTPTVLPALNSARIMRAPANVLPEPGGP